MKRALVGQSPFDKKGADINFLIRAITFVFGQRTSARPWKKRPKYFCDLGLEKTTFEKSIFEAQKDFLKAA